VELIPGGTRIAVDNVNKYRYLDALAQHRLVNSVRDQVDAFIRGLGELVPDNLLSIFDENELEVMSDSLTKLNKLLMCDCFISAARLRHKRL
jgi:hypothetical protein